MTKAKKNPSKKTAIKSAPKPAQKKATSKLPLVVVRTYSAGVHIGELVARAGQEITLANARRLWRWRGANTLNEVALHGVAQEYTRLSEPVPSITLTQAIEVIQAASEAVSSLTTSRWAP